MNQSPLIIYDYSDIAKVNKLNPVGFAVIDTVVYCFRHND